MVPKHVCIIPDGNRRWAKRKGLKSYQGVREGGSYEHLRSLFEELRKSGVMYVSLWGFSTENWKRPKREIREIFDLVLKDLEKFRAEAKENGWRFRHLGRKDRIPEKVRKELESLEKETENLEGFNVQLLLDYGGRDEVIRAVNRLIKEGKKVDEKKFSDYLDTAGIPDVELIIRTSGEKRLSGLMPFQGDYAEYYFTDILFPDFGRKEVNDALKEFSKRKRNIGR